MLLEITDISNLGLGIARDAKNNKIFVQKTVPGDKIEGKIIKKNSKFTLVKAEKIITKSKFRKEPKCQYYSDCGGCSLQHLEDKFYQNYKIQNIQNLLLEADISYQKDVDFLQIGENSRRRVKFHLDNSNNIGFFAENSNNLVKIEHCLMLEKEISDFYLKLQQFLIKFDKNIIKSVQICVFDNILNVIFTLKIKQTSLKLEEKLISFAKHNNINLNLQINQEITPLITISQPKLQINDFWLEVPNNIFLQATKDGLQAIINEIIEFSKNITAKKIIDIYSGIGSYAFALINDVEKITAFEGVKEMTDNINQNAKKYQISNKLQGIRRDLLQNPILSEELQNCDLIIINPPRNGAECQIKEIAKLAQSHLIMVSCDFSSFMRDLKILIDNGFQLQKLRLIDQFYYSYHVEIVAILNKSDFL